MFKFGLGAKAAIYCNIAKFLLAAGFLCWEIYFIMMQFCLKNIGVLMYFTVLSVNSPPTIRFS